ncbi:lysophospholipid acyltransferase family protein [Chitiniphilus eburneus]|uniref:Lipid A biosynthesis acyltransferase n=1 Tax=Chitiniphilus eburneus TaxID=2571148 RepID=A0A4V5MU75_9NEIS|nr:lipid A biosynthesis acyltransferase [Chitiniphilus eburneus]TJZ79158.1 lipid A biosynthesis acyltransferase [Chitiniphilus eburneus]
MADDANTALTWNDLPWRAKLLAVPFWLLRFLPFPVLRVLGAALGQLLYLVPGRRRVGLRNLELCFPTLPLAQRRRMLREHYHTFGACALSYGILWFSSPRRLKRLVVREGYEHYLAIKDRPVIALAPHFLGLDFGAVRHTLDHWGASIYTSTHDNSFDLLLRFGRSRFGPPLLFRRTDGIRQVVRALKRGASLYYLPDQDLGASESIFVPFFGVEAATIPALSRLAQLGNAAVVPMVTTLEGNRFVTRFYPAWEHFPSDDVIADTRRLNAFIEARVLECPAQYFWLHRRFKTRPPGVPDRYGRKG